jgi:hypothetical protein
MTQIHHTHAGELPACGEGHPARHIEDRRSAQAGGGHFIECQCRKTAKHPTFEEAAREWCSSLRVRVPAWVKREREESKVLQFPLPLGGRAP